MPKSTELQPLSKVQKFEPRRINRSQIKNAPYNPRTIDPHAKRKLERKLRKKGLLNALVWNEKTGNLVSGHQRLALIDLIEGHASYSLDVDVVRMTHKEEVENNLFFNNPSAQGTWDLNIMADILKAEDIEIEDAGFDPMDVEVLFDEGDVFGTRPDESEAGRTVDPPKLRPSDAEEDIRRREETKRRHGQEDEQDAKERIRQDRAESKARAREQDDTEFYVIAVFQNRAEREQFMRHINHTEDERYIDGRELCSLLGLNIGR